MNSLKSSTESRDLWAYLSQHTTARIALGRTGGSVRTQSLLSFRLAHAKARDAVRAELDCERLACKLTENACGPVMLLHSQTRDRDSHLLRPDLGRSLAPESRAMLREESAHWGAPDIGIILSDGLSALALERQALPTLQGLLPLLREAGYTPTPVLLVPFARVKIQDEIGELLGLRHTLMLLGERPGLGTPDSLGAYFTHSPRSSCTDADRNCISNIRAQGLPPAAAAQRIFRLLEASRLAGTSGVALKDDNTPQLGE